MQCPLLQTSPNEQLQPKIMNEFHFCMIHEAMKQCSNKFMFNDFQISDVGGKQKSGSGWVWSRHFGVEVGFLTSGFFRFEYFPLGESGFGVFKFW